MFRRCCALLFAAGCGAAATEVEGPAQVTLTSPVASLVPGEVTQLGWTVRDADGSTLPDAQVTFSATPAATVSVSATGLVEAIAPGTATITARAGQATGQVQIGVREGGVISPSGGAVAGFSGAIRLEVPAGAVAAPTAVEFATAPNPVLDPTAVLNTTYTVTVGGAMNAPGTLRIIFNAGNGPHGLPAGDFRIREYRAAWTGIAGGSSDGASIASAPISAGGTFSVGWAAPGEPCEGDRFREFDFWLGAWNVSAGGQNNIAQSDITLAPGGCAILEHYRDGGGGVGRSISFYQPSTGKWYQTYIDNGGSRLRISGGLLDGDMVLLTPSSGQAVERWLWSVEGNNVRQTAAVSSNGGASYAAPYWNGLYTRR